MYQLFVKLQRIALFTNEEEMTDDEALNRRSFFLYTRTKLESTRSSISSNSRGQYERTGLRSASWHALAFSRQNGRALISARNRGKSSTEVICFFRA